MSDYAQYEADLGVSLTERQQQVLILIVKGSSNRQIAGDLGIAEGTVRGHVQALFDITGLTSRVQLAVYALRNGIAQ